MEGRLMIRLFDLQSYYFSDSDEYDEWLTLSAYMYLQSSGYSILAERQMVCCDCFFWQVCLQLQLQPLMPKCDMYITIILAFLPPPSCLLPPISYFHAYYSCI